MKLPEKKPMRIVTRPDFDGVVCAVLLFEAEDMSAPALWVSPNDMQKGLVDIRPGDIIANLPYDPRCSLWFDHHFSNRIRQSFDGLFGLAPSAAGLVYKYYREKLKNDYSELVRQTDKIDAADLSLDEILTPERYPYVLLSMTIRSQMPADAPYWNQLVDLLRKRRGIGDVLSDPAVKQRCDSVVKENRRYRKLLAEHTVLKERVAVTDFRAFDVLPQGNRFLVYSMFPEAAVSVKIGYQNNRRDTVVVKVGHSILNRSCRVNIGQMLSYFEGGGHKGAGSCRFHVDKSESYLEKIIEILVKNEPEGGLVEKKERSGVDRRATPDRRRAAPGETATLKGDDRRRPGDRRVHPEPRKNWPQQIS